MEKIKVLYDKLVDWFYYDDEPVTEDVEKKIRPQAKQIQLDQYCGVNYPNHCKVLTSQLEDGKVYEVEI